MPHETDAVSAEPIPSYLSHVVSESISQYNVDERGPVV